MKFYLSIFLEQFSSDVCSSLMGTVCSLPLNKQIFTVLAVVFLSSVCLEKVSN